MFKSGPDQHLDLRYRGADRKLWVYVAYANHSGDGFTGHSCLATPFGRNAVLLDREEGVAVVELVREAIPAARRLNTYLSDLGPE